MKRLFILMLIAFTTTAQAQRLDTARFQHMTDRELGLDYLKKSKSQKTVAWILLGTGLIATNLAFYSSSGSEFASITGSIAVIASAGLFISSARNKGRAEILLRNQNVPMAYKYRQQVTGIGVRIALSR